MNDLGGRGIGIFLVGAFELLIGSDGSKRHIADFPVQVNAASLVFDYQLAIAIIGASPGVAIIIHVTEGVTTGTGSVNIKVCGQGQ